MSASVDITTEGIKMAPPTLYSGALLMGWTPAEWITALTLLYLVLSIGLLIPKYLRQFREWRQARKARRQAGKDGADGA